MVDKNMLRLGDEAMLKSAITTNGLLVCPGVEESNVEGFVLSELGKIDGIHVLFRIVIVVTVASKTS